MYRLLALLCLGALAVPASAQEDARLKEALAFQAARKEAIRKAEPAIACILVSRSDLYRRQLNDAPPADEPGRLGGFRTRPDSPLRRLDLSDPTTIPESYGSGVVVDGNKGLVLTNYHVVRDAAKVFVRLPSGRASYADIHAADPRSDLAVLRLLDPSLLPIPEIKLGAGGPVEKGDAVLTLANPFAAGFRDGSPSVSWGMVSNLRRRAPGNPSEQDRTKTLHHYGTLLQLDARLNLGCSGGAVVNLKGELIGLITALAAISGSETPGGYAVPFDASMKRILDQLRQGKEVEYGFLGIRPYGEPRPEGGVRLEAVTEGSPAWNAGLRRDSVILKINDQPVRDFDDLFLVIGPLLAGNEVRLEVDGEPRQRTVTLAKFAVHTEKLIASNRPAPRRGLRVDYTSVLLMRLTPTMNRMSPGVLVREVVSGSPAYRAKLQADKVITQVNGRAVHTPTEFYAAMDEHNGSPIELTLLSPEGLPDKVKLDVR